jgi:hypothetical protein
MRPPVPLVVATIVLLAGCSGGAGGPLAGGSPTPAGPVYELPLDPDVVAAGHNESLRAAGSFTADTNVSAVDPSGEPFRVTSTAAVDLDDGSMLVQLTTEGITQQALYVAPDGSAYQRLELSDGAVQYRRLPSSPDATGFFELPVRDLVEGATFAYRGRDRVDGVAVSVYEVTELEQPVAPAQIGAVDASAVTDVEARLAIDDDGLIRRISYRLETADEGATRTVALSITLRDVGGTSVERPGWVDEVD